jgi:hypothetical protein
VGVIETPHALATTRHLAHSQRTPAGVAFRERAGLKGTSSAATSRCSGASKARRVARAGAMARHGVTAGDRRGDPPHRWVER